MPKGPCQGSLGFEKRFELSAETHNNLKEIVKLQGPGPPLQMILDNNKSNYCLVSACHVPTC